MSIELQYSGPLIMAVNKFQATLKVDNIEVAKLTIPSISNFEKVFSKEELLNMMNTISNKIYELRKN